MSKEHEELIRAAYDAANRGDVSAAQELADPDIEMNTPFTRMSGRTYRGVKGVAQWLSDVRETWETIEQSVERFIPVDDQRTIAITRFRGQGKGSGVEVDQLLYTVVTIRDGKVKRIETHDSLEEVLAAAGISDAGVEDAAQA